MLGILFILLLSSVLAFFCYGKVYDTIGIIPVKKRIIYFIIAFVAVALLALLTTFIETVVSTIKWQIKQPVDYFMIGNAVRYYFLAVLTEELIFRGFLLYALVKRFNAEKAKIISAVCFGIYHWFSYQMLDSGLVPLLYVFIMTGLAGYCWAHAFIKSGTIWLALGMHFGWNITHSLFHGKPPYGSILYSQISKTEFSDITNLFISLFTGIFPSVVMYLGLYLYFSNKKEYKAK